MFGAELLILRGVVDGGAASDGTHRVTLSTGEELEAPALLCAVGVEWRRLNLAGLEELLGRGVYYGAGRSEAPRHRGGRVAIVGGGNSAGQAALNFAAYAERVTMLCRGPSLAVSLSRYLAERIADEPRIDVRLATHVTELHGDGRLDGITVEDAAGNRERLEVEGLFVAIGGVPRTQWAENSPIRRDEAGYIVTGPDLLDRGDPPAGWPLERPPLALEANLPGFFVAGDVRHGSTKRVAAAVGEGANAVALVHRYLEERRTSR
jgi:thioredoxin reductase (NADPH)